MSISPGRVTSVPAGLRAVNENVPSAAVAETDSIVMVPLVPAYVSFA